MGGRMGVIFYRFWCSVFCFAVFCSAVPCSTALFVVLLKDKAGRARARCVVV